MSPPTTQPTPAPGGGDDRRIQATLARGLDEHDVGPRQADVRESVGRQPGEQRDRADIGEAVSGGEVPIEDAEAGHGALPEGGFV